MVLDYIDTVQLIDHMSGHESSLCICFRQSGMEVGVASYTSGRPVGGSPDRSRGPHRGNLHVEFAPLGEVKERKEKYLTAKYGAHQMSLIRKRLGVEMWMFDQLQTLYPSPVWHCLYSCCSND